jgi:hypothetical protein
MRPFALRITLAGLLISTVIGKICLAHVKPSDMRSAAIDLVSRKGWAAYEETGNAAQPLGNAIHFRATGCQASGQIFVVPLNLQDAPMLDHMTSQGYARRFVYLGRTWLNEDRAEMRLEWLKYKALSLLWLGRYEANESALIVVEPPDCGRSETVDWSGLWERR